MIADFRYCLAIRYRTNLRVTEWSVKWCWGLFPVVLWGGAVGTDDPGSQSLPRGRQLGRPKVHQKEQTDAPATILSRPAVSICIFWPLTPMNCTPCNEFFSVTVLSYRPRGQILMNTPFGQRMLRLYDVMIEVVMVCNVI